MTVATTDRLLGRMFRARRITLQLLAGLLVLEMLTAPLMALVPDVGWFLIPVVDALLLLLWLAILTGSAITWCFVFRVGRQEASLKYAVGHVLICVALTPVAFVGIILVPLLIYYDIDRWRQLEADACRPTGDQPIGG